jgi:hypothetical protein
MKIDQRLHAAISQRAHQRRVVPHASFYVNRITVIHQDDPLQSVALPEARPEP